MTPYLLAGHSLGEYTALLASGVFSFKDAVRLTRKRGLLMEEACPAGLGGMVALMGPVREKVEEACRSVSKDDYVASPANLNSPDQLVLSGHMDALREVVERLKGRGLQEGDLPQRIRSFSQPPDESRRPSKLKEELARVVFSPMKVPVVSNVDAASNQESGKVVDLLFRQMFSPVLWESCVRNMCSAGRGAFPGGGAAEGAHEHDEEDNARYSLLPCGNDGGDRGGPGGVVMKGKVTIVTGASRA